MEKYLFIGLGGFLGSIARFGLASLVQTKTESLFPYGTMLVNIIGCFFIGLLMTLFQERFVVSQNVRLLLIIGILGGFTTFSSFSYDTFALIKSGNLFAAGLNAGMSLFGCLIATWAGFYAGENF
ncbi:MAG: fluoride efflux transporter CrcB [Bacteriovoracaceae bacterium]|nr:fluoride efflux transporter CrcB [Bacteroidota bacterium]